MVFSQMHVLFLAMPSLIVFSLFTQMAEGATYSVVPFINKKALGAVAGVVGAGGNAGAVLAGFLFKNVIDWSEAFFILGVIVTCASFLAFFVRFSTRQEDEERANFAAANIETLRRRAEKANAALEEGCWPSIPRTAANPSQPEIQLLGGPPMASRSNNTGGPRYGPRPKKLEHRGRQLLGLNGKAIADPQLVDFDPKPALRLCGLALLGHHNCADA